MAWVKVDDRLPKVEEVNSLGFRVRKWLLFSAAELANMADRARPHRWARPCVYVLYRDGNLVYVGATGNIYNRLVTHRRVIGFDAVKVKFLTDPDDQRPLESRLIDRLRPSENRMIPRRYSRG